MCGLFNQDKLLPIRHMPISIELELVSNREDCIAADAGMDAKEWNISDAQVKCDLLQLDNSLENEYTEHLLS
eukprot:7897072-Heterocapsa_arctica.AAC.1